MTASASASEQLPAMPLDAWAETKETLHRFVQIVGKVRLAESVRRNHWWNVAFHVTGRGITTRPMGTDPVFTIDFDFVAHRLLLHTINGRTASFSLLNTSVADFYRDLFDALRAVGVSTSIRHPEPFDLADATPFAQDTAHDTYDAPWVTRYWHVLTQVSLMLEAFAARYSGKTSPVHHFWHTLDLAVTRFSDRVVEQSAAIDPVTREAYSREVISCGFWFGDDNIPAPAFYAYTAPEPAGLADQPLHPAIAQWVPRGSGHLAVLGYDDVRATADPTATVLDFYESAYQAGARLAGWDADKLACAGGATDPHASKPANA